MWMLTIGFGFSWHLMILAPSDNTIPIPHRSKASSPISWSNAAERAGPCARPLRTPLTRLCCEWIFCWTFGKQWIERCLLCTVFWKHINGAWYLILSHFSMLILCANQLDGPMGLRVGKGNMKWVWLELASTKTRVWQQHIYIYMYKLCIDIYHIASNNQYQTTICNHWTKRLEKLNIHLESWIGCLVVLIQ